VKTRGAYFVKHNIKTAVCKLTAIHIPHALKTAICSYHIIVITLSLLLLLAEKKVCDLFYVISHIALYFLISIKQPQNNFWRMQPR